MKYPTLFSFLFMAFATLHCNSQNLGILKYQGGGDWYSNPTALPNLIKFCNTNIGTQLNTKPKTVEAGSASIFQYPLVHMTGHGNVVFSEDDIINLRKYLISGGFLHIDDNYGMKPYIMKELERLFPNNPLEELGKDHPIFSQEYQFPQGLPKIHEHDGQRPQAIGVFLEKRLAVLFTFEADLGDGWEDPSVHNDPEDLRQKALKMGANIVSYAFKN